MSALNYDPNVQVSHGGPLTTEMRQRIHAIKEKHDLNFGDIATKVGIAGSTLGNLTRYEHNVSPRTASRLKAVVGEFEAMPLGDWRGAPAPADALGPLSIPEAKARVALGLGVPETAVEITVKY
jgi:hypothetical protein